MGLEKWKEKFPQKFLAEEFIFGHIHRGDRIFIGTGCGEPQHLVKALSQYVQKHPKSLTDAELLQVWTMGINPHADEIWKDVFRHNSFFISDPIREAVNQGAADYTPVFLSQVPSLFYRGLVPIDVALIQTSPPDDHGFMNLGVSVDIVKAAAEKARLVVAQVNPRMPRVHGDGFIHIEEVDFILPHEEPILEFVPEADTAIADQIGKYVARLIRDGDTIQIGYGAIPNAILTHLGQKRHLGVHSELLTDGVVELMKRRVIDNTRKTINRGKTIASFCMGRQETYAYLHDNPAIELRTIDYTNNPLIIAQHERMTAINTALEIDLTGQASAESIGRTFYSGIGGQADFMRGAALAREGKTILALPSTADQGRRSRIVPFLREGAGVTLHRGDVHYVVTEYGIAHLRGKNIRERAMALIAIAHPNFRSWLIEEAKKSHLIYPDQAFIPGLRGEYPEHLEIHRTTKTGLGLLIRPVRLDDEPLLKEFFYSLSENSLYRRFISLRKDMPHERLQSFVVIDYTKEMVLLAVLREGERDVVVGMGQYSIDEATYTAEVGFAVRDDYQNKGIGTELLAYLTLLAKQQGLLGFYAEVLVENRPMLHLFEKMGFRIEKRRDERIYELNMTFP
ncbi:MAG: GNAT family N-acetyltransferase [Desulfobacterota bacterium]|nr:GNAT family N-acetyltransferase [Thermodesulfobacteriota bacterium]